ncbi:MAG: YkgJ family cysteine cluster protein [Flavobacteriales bacterium]|nr:YkgJ family cysteine cluster protein [Flavobacteriales bacterium]
MITDISYIKKIAQEKESENIVFRKKLINIPFPIVDKIFHAIVKEVEQQIDCTQCGNCCKVLEPEVSDEEIIQLAKFKEISIESFKKNYISIEPNTSVQFMKGKPCIFLKENLCSIYNNRPGSCRDYPHLHHERSKFRMKRIMEQYSVCPIVFNSIEALKKQILKN